jgi:hypothetical protein
MDVEQLAQIEVTSEAPGCPIDSAFVEDGGHGWRAAQPGEQLLRLLFDTPQHSTLIRVAFVDADQERVQEFTLRWSSDHGGAHTEIVRQQFAFSPSGATREVEEYAVDLHGVTDLELHLIPDMSGRPVVATLAEFRIR